MEHALAVITLAPTLLMVGQPGSRRNQATDHHVLFQAAQVVALACHRCFGQHPCGLLEGGRGDERFCRQAGLGDAQQDTLVLGREFLGLLQQRVLLQYLDQLDLITRNEVRVAGIGDLHLAQHLTHDNLDVLVVDANPLQAIDFLDFSGNVLGQFLHPQQPQNIVRIARAIRNDLAPLYRLAFEDSDLTPFVDQCLIRITAVIRRDHQAPLALGLLAEADHTTDLGKNHRFFGLARFKQVRYARQTTGDVLVGRGFNRNPCHDFTNTDLGIVVDRDNGLARQQVLDRRVGARHANRFTAVIRQQNHRTAVTTSLRAGGGLNHLDRGEASHFVNATVHGHTFDHVDILRLTLDLGDDRVSVRIPLGDDLAGFHCLTVLDRQFSAIGQLVVFTLTTVFVSYRQGTGARYHDQLAVGTLNKLHVVKPYATAMFDLDAIDCRRTRCRTTDVEGTHGQLGARLTDGLRGDNANRFPDIDLVATRQITAVARRTHTVGRSTGDGAAHHNLIDAHGVETLTPGFVEQGALFDQHFLAIRRNDVLGHHTAQYALGQGDNDIATFDHRMQGQAMLGAAIGLGDYHVLGHVDQTPGQVTRVSGLEGGIGQTFPCTVGRDEVLQYVQTLAEVGHDRRLDNRAVRLGHQAPHARQLTNLRSTTPCARVGHDEHAVERSLLHLVAIAVDHGLFLDTCHHRLGHLIVGLGPDIDHLVVLLTGGHQTRGELVLDLLDLGFGSFNDFALFRRNNKVIDANRDARPGRHAKTGIHQLVSKNHRRLEAGTTIHFIEQAGDGFLLHLLIDQLEGHAIGQDAKQQCTAHCGVVKRPLGTALAALFVDPHFCQTHLDSRMQRHALDRKSTRLNSSHVR